MAWDDVAPRADELKLASSEPLNDWTAAPPKADELGQMSKAEAFQHGAEQGATLGFGDEAQGALEGIGQAIGIKGLGAARNLDEWGLQTPNGLDRDKFKQAYLKTRDKERDTLHKAEADHPVMYGAGQLAGGLALPVPGGATTSLAKAAKTGALIGGATGLGSSEADNVGDALKDTATGVGLGAGFGAGGYALAKGVDAATPYLGNKLKDVAETKAFKSSGAMLKDFRTAAGRDQIKPTGRFMLDNGLVKAGDKFSDVADRASTMNETAASRLNDIYDKAGEAFDAAQEKVGFDPVRDKAAILNAAKSELGDTVGADAALSKLDNYLDQVIDRHSGQMSAAAEKYGQDVSDYKSKFRQFLKDRMSYRNALGKAGEDLDQPVLSGFGDDLQRTSQKPVQVELHGEAPNVMRAQGAQYEQQPFLPDLPTGNSEAERLFAKPGDANFGDLGGDAADRLGKRATDALEGPAQRDFLNHNTAEQLSMFGKQGEIGGLDLVPRKYAETMQPTTVHLKGQPEFPIMPEAPARPVSPDLSNPLNPSTAKTIKTAIDDEINYARNPLTKQPANEKAFQAARRAIAQKIDDSVEAHGGQDLADQLKAANKDYGISKQIEKMASDRVNRENANRAIGLTDTIAGGAGATIGGTIGHFSGIPFGGAIGSTVGGALGTGANKLMRTYGTSTSAVVADKVSQFLMRSPAMQKLSVENPRAFQAAVIDLTQRWTPRAESALMPKAAGGELDKDSSKSSQFPENPAQSQQRFLNGN